MEPMEAIQAERRRQIEAEGWTPEHDDQHETGDLLRAATIYYQHAARKDMPLALLPDGAPFGWPWDRKWWKPKDPRRDLVRAGALALAEKDRIIRQHQRRVALRERRRFQALANGPYVAHVDRKLELIVAALANLPAETVQL